MVLRLIKDKGRVWVLVGLACWAILSVGRAAVKHAGTGGALDFHSFWFYGHFLWQGTNPYAAFVQGLEPTLPIVYWDGKTQTEPPVAQQGLSKYPTNSAPMLWLLAIFSRGSWNVAKWGWFVCNLFWMALIPFVLLQSISRKLPRWQQLWVILGFASLTGTRVALWTGQTTLLVMGLMVLAVWWVEQKPIVAGILLGIALAKYSLALPVLLLFLYRRHWRAVVVSLNIQAIALVAISFLAGGFYSTVQAYSYIFTHHWDVPGVHWGNWLPFSPLWEGAIMLLGTLVLFLFLWRNRWQANKGQQNWGIMTILSLWVLLVAYHGLYDTVLVAIYGVWLLAVGQTAGWTKKQWGLFLAPLGLFLLPGEIVTVVVPAHWLPTWLQLLLFSNTLGLQIMLLFALWVYQKQAHPQTLTS